MNMMLTEPDFLDNNGEDEICVVIETTTKELAKKKTGTCCGYVGNKAFKSVFNKIGDRRVIGWYDSDTNRMCGMVHIEGSEREAEEFEAAAEVVGGSLRFNGCSAKAGFLEFEIE